MDSADDDFGELYVDEKVQATATFAGDVGFVKSCEESECTTTSDKMKEFEGSVKPDSECEMKKLGLVTKDSSSFVDACAVNMTDADEESEYSDSDDDLNIVLKDDDSKVFPVAFGKNSNNDGYIEASQSCSFQKRRIGNWCTMPNGRIVNGHMTMEAMNPSLGMSQYGYDFSHPWYRTTCDANFDVFEKKRWRNPGTDINDFFNFGLNEQSWNDYCKPLGRAIVVRDGTHERISSVDLHRPRDSDPDVVIQIPVTNDVEELSSMPPVDGRSLSKTSTTSSRSEEFHSDNGNDLNSSGESMKEEASMGCEDEKSPPKENCCSREVTPCDNEFIEEEKEETCWNSDNAASSSVERESSLGDRFRFSPTSSYSVGKTEESEDSETELSKGCATDCQREVSTPPRRTRFAEHEASSIQSGERSGSKYYRDRRYHEDSSKRHCGRVDYGVHKRIKHRNVKDASPTPDPDLGKKMSSGHGSWYRDSSKNWQNGPKFTLEKVEGKGFPHSNRKKRHGRSYSSVDHDQDREHRFGWRNNKETLQGRGFIHSNGYQYEARLKEYNSRSSSNLNQRNSRLSVNDEEDRYGRQHCERKYGRERSPGLAYESRKERNQYDELREPYYQDRIPITEMDYRYQLEYSSAHESQNPNQSRKNDLHCIRRDEYKYNFRRHRYEDGVYRTESGTPFSEVGRREFQGYGINEELSEIDKRHHYTPDWHLDRFDTEKDVYKHRLQDTWSSPSLSLRDSWYTKESRGDSWRDDTRDFRTTEAYDSQNNQFYTDAPRDGWMHNVSILDRLTYEDDWIRQDRGKYQLTDDIQCSMREVAHYEYPSYTDEILVRDTRILTHNRISTKQRSGYFESHIHEIDHRSKKLRRDGHAFVKHQDNLTGRQDKLSNQSRRRFSKGQDTKEQKDHQKPRNVINRRNEKEEARNIKGIEIDVERIQESLKKMEKRRERFKDTKFLKTAVATFQSQTEQGIKTDIANQERPVRKRRWCAS